jgi:cyclopropane-fatty-acyl-phospholipid synthase
MASRAQIQESYDYMDELFRLTFGEHGDCSAAMYDGDFSKTLEEAQQAKHTYILDNLRLGPGSRVLDVGCGWGPFLRAAQERGASAVGLTLSARQAAACRRNGLNVRLLDWKDMTVKTMGRFNGVVSVGSFEHFCSMEEYVAGQQEAIYGRFFQLCSELLGSGDRLYLQTMLWGTNVPRPERISLKAPRGSDEFVLALVSKFYPGSWLPCGVQQIARCARPHFEIVSLNNGRPDYIETMNQWNRLWEFRAGKLWPVLKLIPRWLLEREFRYKVRALVSGSNHECLKRGLIDHQRMVLEKKT